MTTTTCIPFQTISLKISISKQDNRLRFELIHNYPSRRVGAAPQQNQKQSQEQANKKSDFNYDIEFSDDDDHKAKNNVTHKQNNQKRGSDIDDFNFGSPTKIQSNSNQKQSGLPPIQNNNGLPQINKPSVQKQPIQLDPFDYDNEKEASKKKVESDIDDLDDLDDIYGQSGAKKEESPHKNSNINSNQNGKSEAIKKKPNFANQNVKQEKNTLGYGSDNKYEEDYNENYEDDEDQYNNTKKQSNQKKDEYENDDNSSLSDLPDLDPPSPGNKKESAANKKQNIPTSAKNQNAYNSGYGNNNNSNNGKNNNSSKNYLDDNDENNGYGNEISSKPFTIQSKKANDKQPSKTNLPPQPSKGNSSAQNRNRNDSYDNNKSKNRERSAESLGRPSLQSLNQKPVKKTNAQSRDVSRNKLPPSSSSKSKTREPSASNRMFRVLNMRDLEKLLENKNYEAMNFKDLKTENEALREKLKTFNQQLTEKIEHNQPMIQNQAAQQNSSNQPRSRSTQMKTADAERENNLKILKRLWDEYDKLEQRQQIVEDQGYASKLKQQIETSKILINKFKLNIKQIILKNDQQAKELSKIERGDGVPDSVKESHNLKVEVQSYVDKINELEKRKEEIEEMFKKKADLIEQKEHDLNEKMREAKQLNVDVNLQSNSYKRKEKYKELQKNLEILEKNNQTQIKLGNTKETIQKRELDEIQREVSEKDQEINQMEIEIMEFKNKVQDRIDREKIYSRHIREMFNRLPESETGMSHHRSTDSIPRSNHIDNISPIKHNNLVSPAIQAKKSSNTKPNLKFVKKQENTRQSAPERDINESVETNNEVESESINFHQKMNSRSNLNQESEKEEEVISKPFNFKKSNNQEARVRKGEDNQNNQSLTVSPQKQNVSNNNIENTPSSSYNFKKKNEETPPQPPLQNLNNLKQPTNTPLVNTINKESEEDSVFAKPQKMFKFKKDNNQSNENSAGYNPVESMAQPAQQQQQQQQQQPQNNLQPKEDDSGYNFSANSRVSRLRNNHQNNNEDQQANQQNIQQAQQKQLSKIEEEKSKLSNPSENKTNLGGGYNPSSGAYNPSAGGYNPTVAGNVSTTNNNNTSVGGGGYVFSGVQDQNKNSSQNTLNNLSDSYQPVGGVSRRRGVGADGNENKEAAIGGYQPSNLVANSNHTGIQQSSNNNQNKFDAGFGNDQPQKNQNSNSMFNNNDKDDDLTSNAVSRRRQNPQKNDSSNIAGEYNFSRNQTNTNEVFGEKKVIENEKKDNDNKWNWNSNTNDAVQSNKLGGNELNQNNINGINSDNFNANGFNLGGVTSTTNAQQYGSNNKQANGINANESEQPKSFNFKKKLEIKEEQSQAVKQPESNIGSNIAGQTTQAASNISNQTAQKPPAQQQSQVMKPDDDYQFLGPNDRRRAKKPNAAEAVKVQKRDIFGGGADVDEQTINLAAPKEVGGSSNQYQAPQAGQKSIQQQSAVNNNKKSALDDDDDEGSGLDFLKQDKPKVNYNDDDDDLFGKKPSKPAVQQNQPSSLGLGAKKNENKQENEKKLASKAQNKDFFDDLF